jgi:competence protein ComQ
MQGNTVLIEKIMQQAVYDYFLNEAMIKHTSTFIAYKMKKICPFADLTVLHYQMFDGKSPHIYQAAASIELMILALDIFDDIQDQDNPSVPWSQIEPALSTNIAISLLMLSITVLGQSTFETDRKCKAIHYLNEQVLKAVNGQYTDLTNSIHSEEDYIQMAKNKSGSLLACACLVGTALAGEAHHSTVREYAELIGIAAQIKNDINDIVRWDEKNDLIHKKKTLPTLFLLQNELPSFQIIRDYYEDNLGKEALYKQKFEIKELIEQSGAIEYANVIMRVHQLNASERIEDLGVEQAWKEKLLDYV